MADNSQIKQHVSIIERTRWDKVVNDFANHLGSGGSSNHRLGDGNTCGFSTNDYTNIEKQKLAGIEEGALNNPHPATHPYTMITGLKQVSWTADYNHLVNIPKTFIAGGGDSDTVGGIRITINDVAPENPQNSKEIWIDTTEMLMKIYHDDEWVPLHTVYA